MSKIYLSQYSADSISFFIDYFKTHIAEYAIAELTNDMCGDIPSINESHPLAMEYGNILSSGEDNFTSYLPAIGIELLTDAEYSKQPMGRNYKIKEVDQTFIDNISSINIEERFKRGILISDTKLNEIQAALDVKVAAGQKLFARTRSDLDSVNLNISVWSNNGTVTRIIYLVIKSLLKRIKQDASVYGFKEMKVSGQGAFYNYDFSETLFGAEFSVSYTQGHSDVEIDTELVAIENVEEFVKTGLYVNEDLAGSTGGSK